MCSVYPGQWASYQLMLVTTQLRTRHYSTQVFLSSRAQRHRCYNQFCSSTYITNKYNCYLIFLFLRQNNNYIIIANGNARFKSWRKVDNRAERDISSFDIMWAQLSEHKSSQQWCWCWFRMVNLTIQLEEVLNYKSHQQTSLNSGFCLIVYLRLAADGKQITVLEGFNQKKKNEISLLHTPHTHRVKVKRHAKI